eukprot:4975103-Alexandrium_andersonii.AAC.1
MPALRYAGTKARKDKNKNTQARTRAHTDTWCGKSDNAPGTGMTRQAQLPGMHCTAVTMKERTVL